MNFLKKFGAAVLKGLAIVSGVAPLVEQSLPSSIAAKMNVGISDLTQLAGIITTVESVGQSLSLPGPQKLTAAAPLVAQAVLQSTFMLNKTIADQAGFTKACGEIAGGIADLLNSLHDNSVQVQSKT